MPPPQTAESPGRALGESLCTIAVASSVAALTLGFIYWLARAGFVNPVAPVLKSVGLALLLLNAPFVLWWRTRKQKPGWMRSYPFLFLVTLALVAAIGRIQIEIGAPLSIPISVAGYASFLFVALTWSHFTSLKRAFLLIPGSAFFSTWAAGVVWGRIYKTPVFLETMIATGIVHHDNLTLTALGNMLRTYHRASEGLDGLTPYMAYHWGTPWMFAQFANLTDSTVLNFYQRGYVVTFLPLFFGSVLAFGAIVRLLNGETRAATRDVLFWLIFLAGTIGIMPLAGMDALGVWTSNLVISESYAAAIPPGLMLLAVTMIFWQARGTAILAGTNERSDYVFAALVPAGLIALGYIKISFMILGYGAALYAFLRLGLWRRKAFATIAIVATPLIYIAYKRTSLVAHHEGLVPFDFIRSYVPPAWFQFFVLFQLFWTLVYVVLRLRREHARTVGDAITLVKERRVLDAEVLVVVAVAGILPGMFLHIDGGSAFYFSDVQRWIAVGLLLGMAPLLVRLPARIKFTDLRVIALLFIAVPLVVSAARNSVHWTVEMLKANATLRAQLYENAGVPALPAIRALPHLNDPRILSTGLERSANYNAVTQLMALYDQPLELKRRTAVFVPQSDTAYWHILKRPKECSFSSFLVPAFTGMAMVDGMPPFGCTLSHYYGLSLFQRRTRPQTEADIEPAQVCARAARMGFTRVLMLRFDATGRVTQHPMDCKT